MNEEKPSESVAGEEASIPDTSLGDLCVRAQDDEPEPIDVTETPYMKLLEKRSAWRWRAAKQWRPRLIEALKISPAITLACEAAGIDHDTYSAHTTKDPVFAKACAHAEMRARDLLLQSAWNDGVVGYEKPVYQGGVMVGTILERSDTMRAMLLKGFIPERFDRAQQINISGQIAHMHATPEDIMRLVMERHPELAPKEKLAEKPAGDSQT